MEFITKTHRKFTCMPQTVEKLIKIVRNQWIQFIHLITPRLSSATSTSNSEKLWGAKVFNQINWLKPSRYASAIYYRRSICHKRLCISPFRHEYEFLFHSAMFIIQTWIVAFSNDVLSRRHKNNGLIWIKICDEILFLREHTLPDKRNIDYLLARYAESAQRKWLNCV